MDDTNFLTNGWNTFSNWLGSLFAPEQPYYNQYAVAGINNANKFNNYADFVSNRSSGTTYTPTFSDSLFGMSRQDFLNSDAFKNAFNAQVGEWKQAGKIITQSDLNKLQDDLFNQYNQNSGLFGNFDWNTLSSGLQALGSLGNAYMAGKQLDLAKDQFNFTKDAWAKNWANSVKNYNTLVRDKYQARAYQETGDVNAYNDKINQAML